MVLWFTENFDATWKSARSTRIDRDYYSDEKRRKVFENISCISYANYRDFCSTRERDWNPRIYLLASSNLPEPSTIDGPRTFYSSGKNEITRIIRVYAGIHGFFSQPNEPKFSSLGSRCLLLSIFRKTSGKFLELKFSQSLWISSIVSPLGYPLDSPVHVFG